MEIIKELQDYRYLNWSKTRHSSGTAGTLLKAEEIGSEGKIYYKLSRFDSQNGIIGHEAVNELIVDRLLTAIGVPHLNYDLIRSQIVINNQEFETYINRSHDYIFPFLQYAIVSCRFLPKYHPKCFLFLCLAKAQDKLHLNLRHTGKNIIYGIHFQQPFALFVLRGRCDNYRTKIRR